MRREHAIQPFFAPVARLMPTCLLVDFTHQLIDRDYMVQQHLPGERWDRLADELSSAENDILWQQFGRLLNQIHSVEGSTFGLPYPGFQFSSWSQTILQRLKSTCQLAAYFDVAIPHLEEILNIVHAHTEVLDEIRIPKLLHGDLWLFNLLVSRDTTGARITGLLDADRAWWGDPAADWAMFLLLHVKPPELRDHEASFWQAYGSEPDLTAGGQFRLSTYLAMHASTAVLWANQHADEDTLKHASRTLAEAASYLAAY
jgi:aminoglycoside phosphotransferase (APT) family kinase protein